MMETKLNNHKAECKADIFFKLCSLPALPLLSVKVYVAQGENILV